jgi:hypothetical protein
VIELIVMYTNFDGSERTEHLHFKTTKTSLRKRMPKLICDATQKTVYRCNDTCKALCDCEGGCAYCWAIAEHILKDLGDEYWY